jgi:cysteine desulfurase
VRHPDPLYFDHNATTPVDSRVLEGMLPYFSERFHNPASVYRRAASAFSAVEEARRRVAGLIHARPGEIVFTSGGTEADNLAILGVARRHSGPGGHVITSPIEHSAVLQSVRQLEREGVSATCLGVDRTGRVDPDDLRRAIRADTFLVSIMSANNEIGTIQPIAELARITRERNILFHSDAVQAAGKFPLDVAALGLDLLSLSSHKIYGPKGAGALWVRRDTPLQPLFYGGGHEGGLRSGTENVPAIVGLGLAAELAGVEMEGESRRLAALKERLRRGLLRLISGATINGPDNTGALANTLNVSFSGAEGGVLLAYLDQRGFSLSAGSACSAKSTRPSHVLTAIGLDDERARGSLRISLGRGNDEAAVDLLLGALAEVVTLVRGLEPLSR